ncbi:MAG: hypothetical protein ACPGO3_00690 [Magnetospiraceae bacterium]
MGNVRIVSYHKQATSARTRFLVFAGGTVCAPTPLPDDARLAEDLAVAVPSGEDAVAGAEVAGLLQLATDDLEVEPEPMAWVTSKTGTIAVFAACFTTTDPPAEAAEGQGGRFIELTQARGLPPVELELLRRTYERALG